MAEQKGFITIKNFNLGGLSDSKFSGIKNSLYKLIGIDLHTRPGVIQAEQKLTKDSGATVTELCKVAVASTNGRQYFFSSTSGKIWERDTGGSWSNVYTTSPSGGDAGCLGAYEYQGYIYWATEDYLHRIKATDAEGSAEWSSNADPNWKAFDNGDDTFHPMYEQNQILYIGDANQVAQVKDGTFSSNALDIKTPLRVKCLGGIGTDLLIGADANSAGVKAHIFRWNTWSVSFTNEDTIEEYLINTFLKADNMVIVSAGVKGNLYSYNGQILELWRKIPGVYTPGDEIKVYADSVSNNGGDILFGVSNGSGNPADQGVYRIGRQSRNYPYVMDLPYPISQRDGGDFVLEDVELGAVLSVGEDLFVAWGYDGSFGVDRKDLSNKLDGAYLETMIMNVGRSVLSNYWKFLAAYEELPASTDINLEYKTNSDASYNETTEITDSDRNFIYSEPGAQASTLQVKAILTVNSNDSPTVERLEVHLR